MAIAYKSAGAGVATETSGAALSPQCPATVDANDILILHVFWEGTTSAPSPPGDWTILGGSPYTIETTIGRHWVYGKIAAGTEDGAAVACGAPAVTTQRAARIYSFSGWVSGTITDNVPSASFSHQSHATDPQMPTVTTTLAGALAVALVAQNDNNAFASPTGESGGDWTEAVAEFSANLTPGLSLGLETATPTADPGTISGGSMATTNDPCGVIGFEIRPQAIVNATGTMASTLSPITVAATGAMVFSATATVSLPSVAASSSGTHTQAADGYVVREDNSGDKILAEDGSKIITEGAIAALDATSAVTLSAVTVSATGALVFAGTSSITLPATTTSATGAQSFAATSAIALPAVTVAGTGLHPYIGSANITLASVTTAATGAQVFTATSAVTLSPVTVSAMGRETFTATSAVVLPAVTVAATGSEIFTATSTVALPSVTVDATGTHAEAGVFSGSADITLASVAVNATGVYEAPAQAAEGAIVRGDLHWASGLRRHVPDDEAANDELEDDEAAAFLLLAA